MRSRSRLALYFLLPALLGVPSCAPAIRSVASGGTSGYGDPTPPGMAVACTNFGAQNSALDTSATMQPMAGADNDHECAARFKCTSPPCTLTVTSRMFPGRTNLAFLLDVRDDRPNFGPAAAGGAVPLQEPFQIAIGPGGFYGTRDPSRTAKIYTANGKWIRYSGAAFIEPDQVPKTMTAVVTLTGAATVGRAGWVPN